MAKIWEKPAGSLDEERAQPECRVNLQQAKPCVISGPHSGSKR